MFGENTYIQNVNCGLGISHQPHEWWSIDADYRRLDYFCDGKSNA